MSEVIAGAASGFLMGMVFIGVGAMMLLALTRDPPPLLKTLWEQVPPAFFAMPLAFLSLAIWGLVGVIGGLLYRISLQQAPGAGLGSPNMVYTAGVLLVTAVMAPPLIYLLRRVTWGLLIMMLAFVGIFGWFLPFFSR